MLKGLLKNFRHQSPTEQPFLSAVVRTIPVSDTVADKGERVEMSLEGDKSLKTSSDIVIERYNDLKGKIQLLIKMSVGIIRPNLLGINFFDFIA